MALPSLSWLSAVGAACMRVGSVSIYVVGFLGFIINFWSVILDDVMDAALTASAAMDATSAPATAITGVLTGIGYANAIFDLDFFVNSVTNAMVIVSLFLTVRWIKSVIPTVAN